MFIRILMSIYLLACGFSVTAMEDGKLLAERAGGKFNNESECTSRDCTQDSPELLPDDGMLVDLFYYLAGKDPARWAQNFQQWHTVSDDAEWKRRVRIYVKSGGKLHSEYGINTNPDYTDEGQKRQAAAKYWATFKDVKPDDNPMYERNCDKRLIENYWDSILDTLKENTTDSWKTILYKSYPYWDNLKKEESLRDQARKKSQGTRIQILYRF